MSKRGWSCCSCEVGSLQGRFTCSFDLHLPHDTAHLSMTADVSAARVPGEPSECESDYESTAIQPPRHIAVYLSRYTCSSKMSATTPAHAPPVQSQSCLDFHHLAATGSSMLPVLRASRAPRIPPSNWAEMPSVLMFDHSGGHGATCCDIQLRQLQRGAHNVIAAAGAVLQPIPPARVSDSVCTMRWSAFSAPSASSGVYSTPEVAEANNAPCTHECTPCAWRHGYSAHPCENQCSAARLWPAPDANCFEELFITGNLQADVRCHIRS